MDYERIVSYREGIVTKVVLCNCGCCHMVTEDEIQFRYIELIFEDGSRSYAYEDQEGFQKFAENFHDKRFTSFHEFLTTEELAEEDRGFFSLKYYVRRSEEDYEVTELESVRNKLKELGCTKLEDRITQWGQYDSKVNYHQE